VKFDVQVETFDGKRVDTVVVEAVDANEARSKAEAIVEKRPGSPRVRAAVVNFTSAKV
jgi:hypothetical protein